MVLRAALKQLLMLAALSGAGEAMAASALFCCADENGKQVCGDILPQACIGRAYRELGDSGRTARRVDAPLTAEQRAQLAREEERRKAQEIVLKEQKRKDQALLDTYGTEKDIETLRRRAEQEVSLTIQAAESKIVEARKQRQKFVDEAEFYKKKQLPVEVSKGLRDADYEIQTQESVIDGKKKELIAIRLKFDEDRRRFLEITRRSATR